MSRDRRACGQSPTRRLSKHLWSGRKPSAKRPAEPTGGELSKERAARPPSPAGAARSVPDCLWARKKRKRKIRRRRACVSVWSTWSEALSIRNHVSYRVGEAEGCPSGCGQVGGRRRSRRRPESCPRRRWSGCGRASSRSDGRVSARPSTGCPRAPAATALSTGPSQCRARKEDSYFWSQLLIFSFFVLWDSEASVRALRFAGHPAVSDSSARRIRG